MDILILLFGFALGLIFLVKGADEMVSSAVQIALKFKIPNSIIGATFIGFGTSAPELFASTGAAINGDLDLAIGNIVGSNIANSLLVVAVLFLAIPKDFNKKTKHNLTLFSKKRIEYSMDLSIPRPNPFPREPSVPE